MLNAILVDDEAPALETLTQLLNLYHPEIRICATCRDIKSAVMAVREHTPDIVFLDIEIGRESGFDLFSHFPNPGFKVIFVSGYQQHAVQAFRFSALDYLLKPVNAGHLSDALKKAAHSIEGEKITLKLDSLLYNINSATKSDKKIILKTAENIQLVSLSDIIYCEADGGYTVFHFADKSRTIISSTMGDYEELFSDHSFCRIHQSYLLNLTYFKRYEKTDGGMVILKDGTRLPVATRKKEHLLQRLASL